jgi:glucokinase
LQISGESVKAFSSEGGHCDLAPVTDVHSDLLRHLQERFAHVSYERVLSGPGLLTLHDFVQRRVKGTSPPGEERRPISSAGIAELANLGDPVAVESIELFIQLLGAFAGNAALQWLALGGVYLAGGVTVGLQSFIASHTFTDAFQHKGRMRPLMEQIPVAIVADDDAGLEGITRLAIHHNG